MMSNNDRVTVQLPAGQYYIGDPCYIIPDQEWTAFCDVMFATSDYHVTAFKDVPMLAGSTAFGDGVYADQLGNRYGVDAGTLAVVPRELWDARMSVEQVAKMGAIFTFDQPFTADCHRGVFNFGHVHIDTDGNSDDDDVDYSDIVE